MAVLLTVALGGAAQIIIKNQLEVLGAAPDQIRELPKYIFDFLISPTVWLAFGLVFLGALVYILAISRLPLTYLYPFASLSFPLILILGVVIFGESLTWQKAIGSCLIIGGVTLGAFSNH